MKNLDRNYWYCRDEESLGKIMRLKVSDHFYEDENVIDTGIIASASKSPINPWNFAEKCRQPEIEMLRISVDEMSQSKRHKWKIPMDKRRRYSSGDYLRQQILNDLNSPEILDKSDEALAFDRYNRVRNYLNSVEAIRLHPSDDNDSDIPCDRRRSRRIRRRYSDNRSDCGYHRQRRARGDLERSFDKCDCGRRIDRRTRSDVTPRRRNFTGKSRGKFGENLARSASCPAREWARKPRIYQGFLESGESDDDEEAEDDRDNAELSTETETILQENYLVVEPLISRLQGNQVNAHVPNEFDSMDIGYDSITKGLAKIWMEFQENSRVKKSKTFRIVNGSNENATFYCCNGVDWTDENHVNESLGTMDGSITGDYFRRVYDLLKQRQVDGDRRRNDKSFDPSGYYDDTSSSNFSQESEKKRRRRKKRNTSRGEEVVVSSVLGGQEAGWHHQINNNNNNNDEVEEEVDRSNYLSFCRPQLRDLSDNKRRPPPPPIPAKYKINPRDISKYFNYPNKENSPDYVVNNENKILTNEEKEMGSNLSRHSGKGLNGRRTQSSGNLCDPKGKLNHVGKILVPCSSGPQERYKISGSLPNNLDDKDSLGDDPIDNNNVISDTISGNLGGTLPHKKRSHGVHFSDSPVGALDLVRYRSQDSLEGNPWRYQTDNDLDLVRCKHGNFDLVRKNQSVDTVDTGVKYSRVYDDKYQQNHLDLVGTLPKRRIDPKWCDPSSIQAFQQQSAIDTVDGDLLMKVVHKPECELMKHRKYERLSDAKTSRIEHQDQGYASERSPEDEHPPSLPGKHLLHINPENTFRVTLQKCSRGLGLSVSGGGNAGPVRVKRLFPQQPAALSNKLQSGDILLAANGIPLTGLTNYEALEVLRTTWNTVELLVCRLPGEEQNISPPGVPPPPPARRELPPALRLLNPLPPLQIEPCGEFDIEMTKVAGSLGFTLRKVDSSALGHYVRALVREPALSDGRIQPGDKIVAVDGAPLSPMSHEEAVALLRQCGPRVKLRLYRDLAQTPVSALSPTEPDHPLRPPRTSLRQEAMDMLCDLAVRKLSPGTSNGSSQNTSGTSANSPRRLRRPASRTPTGERENEPIYSTNQVSTASQVDTSDSDQCSIKTQITNSAAATPDDIIDPPALYDIDSIDPNKPSRPSFLNLIGPIEKPNYQFSLESECEETIIIPENDKKSIDYIENLNRDLANELQDNTLPSEPASMPPLISVIRTNSGAFSYKNPAYQSANPTCGSGENESGKNKNSHSSDQDIPGKVLSVDDPGGTKGLLKWKGVMFAPDDEEGKDMPEADARAKQREESLQREGYDETEELEIAKCLLCSHDAQSSRQLVFMVELTRGWNSRLGFSLRPDGNDTVISMVHSDSVAAKDGRLKQGDVLIMVNDENVEIMPTEEIIDLLRKIRGSIGITVARKKSDET